MLPQEGRQAARLLGVDGVVPDGAGPRQRVVAYLGQLEEPQRLGVKEAAEGGQGLRQKRLFDDVRPQWVEVDVKRVRVENRRDFGGPWLGLEVADRLGLKAFLDRALPSGREDVPWSLMALVLVICPVV